MIRQISDTKKDAVIEITGEEVKLDQNNEQVIMVPVLSFKDFSNRGEMLFFLIYRNHSGNPGRPIWKPIYKSEIKMNNNNR